MKKTYATTHPVELRFERSRPVTMADARRAMGCGYRFHAYVVIGLLSKIKTLEGRRA